MVKHQKLLSVANLGIIKHITTIYYLFNIPISQAFATFDLKNGAIIRMQLFSIIENFTRNAYFFNRLLMVKTVPLYFI